MNVNIDQIVGQLRVNEPLDAERQEFIRKTFLWLFFAILGFTAFEFTLFSTGIAQRLAELIFSFGRVGWLAVLGAFVVVGTLTTKLAHADNRETQLMGYAGYIVAEGLIFCPLLYVAQLTSPSIIPVSAAITFLITGALCATVIAYRSNFSFMKPFLAAASVGALGLIILAAIVGFDLGLVFSFAMVLLAAGYILYTTSNVLHKYDKDHYIGAATELFAAVALLFWYVVRIAIELSGRSK